MARTTFGGKIQAESQTPAAASAIVGYLGPDKALVRTGRGLSTQTSSAPIFKPGTNLPIDLALQRKGDVLEPVRALTEAEIPVASAGSVRLKDPGIELTLEGRTVEGAELTPRSVDFANVDRDTDSVASPTMFGADLSTVLRSRLSPQILRYRVSLPLGYALRGHGDEAVVTAGPKVVARIPAPTAVDAQQAPVPVSMSVRSSEIVISVRHRNLDVAYPIDVDPELTINLVNFPSQWGQFDLVGTLERGESYPELFHCAGQLVYEAEECDGKDIPFVISKPAGGPFAIELPETVFPYAENEYTKGTGTVQNRTVSRMKSEQYWNEPILPNVERVSFSGLKMTKSGETNSEYPTQITAQLYSCGAIRWWRGSESLPSTYTFEGHSTGEPECALPARFGIEVASQNYMSHNEKPNGEFENYYYVHTPTKLKAKLEVGAVTVTAKASQAQLKALEEEGFAEENPAEPARTDCTTGDPVNCSTGNAFEEQTDIAIPSLGPDLDFTRYYNSQLGASQTYTEDGNGFGWTSSYSAHVSVERPCHEGFCPEELAVVHQDNGSCAVFRRETGSEPWRPIAASDEATLRSEGSGFVFTLPDQETLTFDGNGWLMSEADRYGNTLRLTRSSSGLLEKATDATGRSLTFGYNSENLITSVTDPMGRTVKYTYGAGESFGLLTSVTQLGTATARWKFVNNHYEHVITSIADALGHQTTFEYSNRQVVKQVDPMGRVRTFKYGSQEPGRETVLIEPNGSETVETFNALGEPTKVTKAAGTSIARSIAFEYDPAGRLLAAKGPAGTTEFAYDASGNRILRKTAGGATTTWTWNKTHDPISEVAPNGAETTIERNASGDAVKISRVVAGLGTVVLKQAFNEKGQLTSRTDPMGRIWKFGYDSYGDRTSATDPVGDKSTKTFNADSQETSVTSPRGNLEGAKSSEFTTTFTLNWLGEVTKAVDAAGRATTYEYDAAGNLKSTTNGSGGKTEYTYDADNELVKVKRPAGDISETGYDTMGQIVSQTDGNVRRTSYARDLLGQITQVTDPLQRVTKLTRSPGGNVSKTVSPEGREILSSFDSEGRLTELSFPGGGTPIKFSYDKEGDLVGLSDESGTSVYVYNRADLLTEATNGHGETVKYEYNLAGQVVKEIYPGGKAVTRGYDQDGRLSTVTDWLGHVFTYGYSADSAITAITFPSASGEVDAYGRNRADEVVEAAFKKGSETLAKLSYSRNLSGEIEKVVTAGLPGPGESQAKLDSDQRLTGFGSATFSYDAASNLTTGPSGAAKFDGAEEMTEAGANKYTYDQLGDRLTSLIPSQGTTTFGYSATGALKSISRPKTESSPAINDSFTYDGLGLRASVTAAGSTNYFLWGKVSPVPNLLGDGRFWYVYGAGGVPLEQIAVKGEQAEYLHYDQGQNVRLVTNSAGQVGEAVTYRPYGGVESISGAVKSAFGFAGQYTDADSGFVYMRARYYDPATGQFISRDPMGFITRVPYGYAGGNPVSRSDPTGLNVLDDITGFFTEENFLSESPLNFVHYYQEEVESIEAGCSYWDSVQHGLEGAGVLTLDAAGADTALDAAPEISLAGSAWAELIATRFPILWLKFLESAAASGEEKPGYRYGLEKSFAWFSEALGRFEREFSASVR